MVQPSSQATPRATAQGRWRQSWFFDLPVLASIHLSFLLGALLLAHALGAEGGGAVGLDQRHTAQAEHLLVVLLRTGWSGHV